MTTNMAKMDHVILTNGLKVGDFLVTRGVYYAPYNKIKCTWMNECAIVAHVGSHKFHRSLKLPANQFIQDNLYPAISRPLTRKTLAA